MLDKDNVYVAVEAGAVMARLLKELWENLEQTEHRKVLRVQMEIKGIDLLEWLGVQHNDIRLYFSGRDAGDLEMAGIGSADMVVQTDRLDYKGIFQHIHDHLSPDAPHLRYYGGISFNPGPPDHDWHAFGTGRFVIPRFELLNVPDRPNVILACNVVPGKDTLENVLMELEQVDFTGKPSFCSPGKPLARSDVPGYDAWKENLEREIEDIKADRYQKTVLARKVELEFKERPDPVALLFFLKHLPTMRYDFMFQFQPCCAFVGSSPERLYKRWGRHLVSEAVAGTRSRGKIEQDDRLLAEELLQSDKERREHDFVIQTIIQDLEPLCDSMEVEAGKGLLKLKEGQHLITHLTGNLKEDVGDDRLVAALHPTPAVGGCPLNEALEAIQRSEPFQRGWYAGVVGTVGVDSADFAVGLRSGRTHDHCLSLYSGVGVVEGSDPEMEWWEVEYKITNFLDIIGNGDVKNQP